MSNVNFFSKQSAEWMKAAGPESDVVVSSRLRLARNLEKFPFLQKLSIAQKTDIITQVELALGKAKRTKKAHFIRLNEVSDLDRQFLLERHLISREHASDRLEKAVSVTPDEVVSVMVLEEDHLRIQAFQPGLNLNAAWRIMNELDDSLEQNLRYSFDLKLGYLTACPTNVGTGLRASCMVHLPGLVLTKQVHKVLQALAKLNLAARGLYGEGTQATGNLFQFSNQMTLGQKEEEIIDNLERVIRQVIEHEREARSHLADKKRLKFEDQIWRACGTLKTARIMPSIEATQFLSLLQLGTYIGIVKIGLSREELNNLFLLIQPAHLQKASGKELTTAERDEARAVLIRDKLKSLEI